MSDTNNPLQPILDELEKDLAERERQVSDLKGAINVLRAKAGLPPRPDNAGHGAETNTTIGDAPISTVQVRPDAFYGKRMGTAAREYLEMRKAGGDGPAKTREIFDALKAGGFQFATKDENVALVSLRNTLRKGSEMFHRLPNGTYGLRAWYPHAKRHKPSASPEPEKAEESVSRTPEEPSAASTSAAA